MPKQNWTQEAVLSKPRKWEISRCKNAISELTGGLNFKFYSLPKNKRQLVEGTDCRGESRLSRSSPFSSSS